MGLCTFYCYSNYSKRVNLKKFKREPPLLREALPVIRLTHYLVRLLLFEDCVDQGPSWLPTAPGGWLTANVSKASQNPFTTSVLCSSLLTTSYTAEKWLGSTYNPQRWPIWLKQASDAPTQAPATLRITVCLAAVTHTEHSFTWVQQGRTSPTEMGHLKKGSIISSACSPRHDTSWQEVTYVFDYKSKFFFFFLVITSLTLHETSKVRKTK